MLDALVTGIDEAAAAEEASLAVASAFSNTSFRRRRASSRVAPMASSSSCSTAFERRSSALASSLRVRTSCKAALSPSSLCAFTCKSARGRAFGRTVRGRLLLVAADDLPWTNQTSRNALAKPTRKEEALGNTFMLVYSQRSVLLTLQDM